MLYVLYNSIEYIYDVAKQNQHKRLLYTAHLYQILSLSRYRKEFRKS